MSTARTTLRRTGAATALAAVGVLAAAGIASGHVTVEDFDVAFGQLPDDTGQLVFKTLQTYSDGKTVRWIERAASGDDEPENPAPVLKLTAKDADTADSVPVTAKSAESETLSASSSDSTARGIGVAGLVVGVLGLSAAVFAVLRGGRSAGSRPEQRCRRVGRRGEQSGRRPESTTSASDIRITRLAATALLLLRRYQQALSPRTTQPAVA